jgi:hypothetical protein
MLCPPGKQPPIPIDMRLGGLHSQYKHIWEKKEIYLTCSERYHISSVAQTID